MRRLALPLVLALAACGDREDDVAPQAPATPAPAAPVVDDFPRYTSLEGCTLLVSKPDEAGYSVERCGGQGGYGLKRNEADGRHNLFVIAPGGAEHSLNLPGVIGSGFSTLGPRVEWRGPPAAPTALIVRYDVAEDPAAPETTVSYLAVARLSPQPCVIGKIAPRPDQNEAARSLADAGGPCLTVPA